MTSEKPPVVIKKYANRRLYNTGTSVYVTLEDLACMVKRGDDFVVYDAKGGEDITRSVLGQIIFEQESKSGQSLLPIAFLRQLIRFYGDSMQMLVPSYLEMSLDKLTKAKGGFADVFGQGVLPSAMSGSPTKNPMADAARPIFAQMEEQARQNVAMFRNALALFTPGAGAMGGAAGRAAEPKQAEPTSREAKPGEPMSPEPARTPVRAPLPADARGEFDDMRRQLEELQRRMEGMAPRG